MRRYVLFEQSFQNHVNSKQDTLCVVFDFVTCESNYFNTLSIEPFGSNTIFLNTFLIEVWQSIAFDNKPCFWTEKV